VPSLLSAEITARTGRDPGQHYADLAATLGAPVTARIEAPASASQRQRLARLTPGQLTSTQLAGETITSVLARAPGNQAPIGGIKVIAPSGWFAARPSGTEEIYKIYAESYKGASHLQWLLREAQAIVDAALAAA
jgi:phosphoglucomutase